MANTTQSASDVLAALEQAAVDGEAVDPRELAEAREAVNLEALVQRGVTGREQQAEHERAEEKKAEAKAAVAAMLQNCSDADLLVEYDAAVRALQALVNAIEARNTLLVQAARQLRKARVPLLGWVPNHTPEGLDPANTARIEQGNEVAHVTANGVTYTREIPSIWVRAAVQDVAAANGTLPIPYFSPLSEMVRGDRPATLKKRTR